MKLTHCKQFCLFIQVICIFFQNLISLRYLWGVQPCVQFRSPLSLVYIFSQKQNILIVHDILYHWQLDQCCLTTALIHHLHIFQLLYRTTSKTWTPTLKNLDPEKPWPWIIWTMNNLDPEKPGSWISWTLKNLDSEKHGINMGLKNMSGFRELCFKKTMCNVIYCLSSQIPYYIFQAKNCSYNNITQL